MFIFNELKFHYDTNSNKVGDFIKTNHYSRSLARGCKHVFYITHKNNIIGAAMVGVPVSRNCKQKYSLINGEILELKRFCLIDNTPKNTESFFLGKILRWFQDHTNIEAIISYADPEYGHEGIIYKATNFNYYGKQLYKQNLKSLLFNGKKYHLRSVYQKNSAVANKLQLMLKLKQASWIKMKPKHIFIYRFNRKKLVFMNEELYINYKPYNETDTLIGEM